jgi:hypothetical protein
MVVPVDHAVMAYDVMVMAHDVMVVVVVNRLRRGHAGREGEGDRRRERQGHEFQGMPPQYQVQNQTRAYGLHRRHSMAVTPRSRQDPPH